VVNGKIIGSVRGYQEDASAHISRMIVHPYFRGRGLSRHLVTGMEQAFPGVRRFEAFTGHKSKRNIAAFSRLGYQIYKTEPFTPLVTWVYLQKDLHTTPPSAPESKPRSLCHPENGRALAAAAKDSARIHLSNPTP
ncbi:MAG TPA: GNAT family N-acetyltransferase, partial [Candidatus Paceibacterota bacterium]|nr:GNAT family N-acetyltransferase [Candidatus Paceibacterota bacterium]